MFYSLIFLNFFSGLMCQVVLYGSENVISNNNLKAISHTCSVVINMLPGKSNSCNILLKKPSGKVIKNIEEYEFLPNLTIRNTKCKSSSEGPTSVKTNRDQNEMFALESVKNEGKGGQIHYIPDKDDDWDDEDPDDDLTCELEAVRVVSNNSNIKIESADNETDAALSAQTTFNLSLTTDQRKSKNELLLPHTRYDIS